LPVYPRIDSAIRSLSGLIAFAFPSNTKEPEKGTQLFIDRLANVE
jgi:hypothetical protein